MSGRTGTFLVAALVLAFCLRLPTLGLGFWLDDYGNLLALEMPLAGSEPTPPWRLYDFGALPGPGTRLHDLGSYAWWADADWRARFLRPLTSLSIALDHALFGRNAVGYHATSLALLALLIGALPGLYRALGLGPRTALLATLLFSLEDGSALVGAWIANRNSLIEVLFAVLALRVLADGEAGRAPPAGRMVAALLLAALATAAKESGVATFPAIALFLFLRHGRGALAGAGLALACAALYVGGYVALGYGSSVVFYLEPWRDPVAWLGRLGTTLALAPVGLVMPFMIDAFFLKADALRPVVPVVGVVSIALVTLIWSRARHHPCARFCAFWAFVWLLPQVGAPPSDRLLFGPMVGFAPLTALFLADVLPRDERVPPGRVPRWSVTAVCVLALPLSGALLLMSGLALNRMSAAVRTAIVEADVGAPELGRREVFLLQASPTLMVGLVPSSVWFVETGDMDVRWWPMQMDARPLVWRRVDERTFELESRARPFLAEGFEGVWRTRRGAPPAGTTWTTAAFSVEALEPQGQGLGSFRVHCNQSLDDERMRFLVWRDGALRHVPPPAVGESLELEPGFKLTGMP